MKTGQNILRRLILTASLCALTACGGDGEGDGAAEMPPSSPPSSQGDNPMPTDDQGLMPSARACRRHDAVETDPTRDLRGIAPGMTWDEVRLALGCLDDTVRLRDAGMYLRMNTYGATLRQVMHATDGRPCRSDEIPSMRRQALNNQAGGTCRTVGMNGNTPYTEITENIRVIFTGLDGAETAKAVFRTKAYDGDARPPIEAVTSALIDKYGEISRESSGTMLWIYDTRDRRMSQSNPAYRQCSVNPDFSGSTRWTNACGVVIGAKIIADRENPLLTSALHVAIMDQAGLLDGADAMEAELKARQDAAQAKEAERAKEAAAEVNL